MSNRRPLYDAVLPEAAPGEEAPKQETPMPPLPAIPGTVINGTKNRRRHIDHTESCCRKRPAHQKKEYAGHRRENKPIPRQLERLIYHPYGAQDRHAMKNTSRLPNNIRHTVAVRNGRKKGIQIFSFISRRSTFFNPIFADSVYSRSRSPCFLGKQLCCVFSFF